VQYLCYDWPTRCALIPSRDGRSIKLVAPPRGPGLRRRECVHVRCICWRHRRGAAMLRRGGSIRCSFGIHRRCIGVHRLAKRREVYPRTCLRPRLRCTDEVPTCTRGEHRDPIRRKRREGGDEPADELSGDARTCISPSPCLSSASSARVVAPRASNTARPLTVGGTAGGHSHC
jgi:hypothetical protein